MELPTQNEVPVLLEFFQQIAVMHKMMHEEEPQFTVHPRMLQLLDDHGELTITHDSNLGYGLRGPNYTIFADTMVDENELDIVRERQHGDR